MEQKTNGMKKFINDPETVVDDMLEGLLIAHSDQLKSIRSDNRAWLELIPLSRGKWLSLPAGAPGIFLYFLVMSAKECLTA